MLNQQNLPHIPGLIPGWAIPTGVILIIVLTIMFIGALSCIRRTGNFETFYFTHLLYVIYFAALFIHGPTVWKWIGVPVALFILELIYRIYSSRLAGKSGAGKSEILTGLVLPSTVTGLVIRKPAQFEHKVGDYVFVKVPAVAKNEWHPFTIRDYPYITSSLF